MTTSSPILIIDDNPDDRALIRYVLQDPFSSTGIREIEGAADFSSALLSGEPRLIITELDLSWITVPDLVRTVHERFATVPIVLCSCAANGSLAVPALEAGADSFVPKTSRGYLDLPDAVKAALFRARRLQKRYAGDDSYRRLVTALPFGVFTATHDGQILDANPALATILGFGSPNALTGHLLPEFFADAGEGKRWQAQLNDVRTGAGNDVTLRRHDGGTVWVRLATWLAGQGSGEQTYLQGVIEDISEQKRAHQELVRRNTVLANSCAELENFASVVSHDLREPLHLVERYSTMLAEKLGPSLDAKAGEYLDHIVHGTVRLRGMIDAILELSRVETRGGTFAPVDFEAVLAESTANLEQIIAETSAGITHDLLPTLAADETQMVQLFQNLLGNALKFRGGEPPTIHVGAQERAEDWLFSVHDNGIGIEPEAASRIFEIFQRLHTQDEYPGMGIGLTLCQRIVQRHGGRIWFESDPGHQTTFFFTIPKHIGQWP